MPSTDKRSNRCPNCKRTYASKTHQTRCLHRTSRKRSSHARAITRRTASEILASSSTWYDGIVVNADFYTQEAA